MTYMLMFFAEEDTWMAVSEVERARAIQQIGAWSGQQAQSGRVALCDLGELVDRGTVQATSTTRNRRYVLADEGAAPANQRTAR